MPRCLIDTSFLVAVSNKNDRRHGICLDVIRAYPDLLLPDVILTEAVYLVRKYAGERAADEMLHSLLSSQPPLVALTYADIQRVNHIRQRYRSANFDFVDCCIMAMAERLNIRHICTLDRRDFSVYQPSSGFLTLLPEQLSA